MLSSRSAYINILWGLDHNLRDAVLWKVKEGELFEK